MTNDQWKIFESSMSQAPEIVEAMFNAHVKEMTQAEVIDLSRCLMTVTRCLDSMGQGRMTDERDLQDLAELTLNMMSGLYGRLMGLARAYDTLITKQVMMEAELASAGK
jgi:hypothetical protein